MYGTNNNAKLQLWRIIVFYDCKGVTRIQLIASTSRISIQFDINMFCAPSLTLKLMVALSFGFFLFKVSCFEWCSIDIRSIDVALFTYFDFLRTFDLSNTTHQNQLAANKNELQPRLKLPKHALTCNCLPLLVLW